MQMVHDLENDLDNKTGVERREILNKYLHQVRIDFNKKENAHIVKVIFNLDLKLAPWIYKIPVEGKGWHPIGHEGEEFSRLIKIGPESPKEPIAIEPHR